MRPAESNGTRRVPATSRACDQDRIVKFSTIDDLLSGRRQGIAAAATRTALKAASIAYGGAMALRNTAFDRRWKRIHRVEVPVISVGNITTGGTGKTPIVAWLVQTLRQMGRQPGILSRGYRSLDGQANDEKLVLDALCPGVPHIQNPDRVAGARRAITEFGCDVLVLDDGFQHRRLHRDLDIVLIDALNPWGYGHLLPRGLLREPRISLRRAGLIGITRANQCSSECLTGIVKEIQTLTSAPIAKISFIPERLVRPSGEAVSIESLTPKAVGACCAIGNPAAFFETLRQFGIPVEAAHRQTFPDHHHYTRQDLALLEHWVETHRLEAVVVTRKDLVKFHCHTIGPAQLLALEISPLWQTGRDHLDALLGNICRIPDVRSADGSDESLRE